MRDAARARLEEVESLSLHTVEELDAFFSDCDQREGGDLEPDWADHLAVMADSRRRGLPT